MELSAGVYQMQAASLGLADGVQIVGASNVLNSVHAGAISLSDLSGVNSLHNVTATSAQLGGLSLQQSTSSATLDIEGGRFGGSGGIYVLSNGSGFLDLTVSNSTFADHDTGISLVTRDDGSLLFDVDHNQITGAEQNGVLIRATTATGNMEGFVRNNTIKDFRSGGVLVETVGPGRATVEVGNNTLSSTKAGTRAIAARAGAGAGDAGDLALTVLANAVAASRSGYGLDLQSHFRSQMCANIRDNGVTDPSGLGQWGIGVRQGESSTYRLERFTGAPTASGEVASHLGAENPLVGVFPSGTPIQAFVEGSGFTPVSDGYCRVPTP